MLEIARITIIDNLANVGLYLRSRKRVPRTKKKLHLLPQNDKKTRRRAALSKDEEPERAIKPKEPKLHQRINIRTLRHQSEKPIRTRHQLLQPIKLQPLEQTQQNLPFGMSQPQAILLPPTTPNQAQEPPCRK